jgi:hypothetical protein
VVSGCLRGAGAAATSATTAPTRAMACLVLSRRANHVAAASGIGCGDLHPTTAHSQPRPHSPTPCPYLKSQFAHREALQSLSRVPILSQMSERGHFRGGGRGHGGNRGGRGGGGGGRGGGQHAQSEKPKKENILDLTKYMDKQVNVKFNGGRESMCPPLAVKKKVEADLQHSCWYPQRL